MSTKEAAPEEGAAGERAAEARAAEQPASRAAEPEAGASQGAAAAAVKPQASASAPRPEGASSPPAVMILPVPVPGAGRIFGLTPAERLARGARAAGAGPVLTEPDGAPPPGRAAVVLRGDILVDDGVLRGLVERPGQLLVQAGSDPRPLAAHVPAEQAAAARAWLAGAGPAPEGLESVTPATVAGDYRKTLRKREAPWVMELDRLDDLEAERRLYESSYKGVTDLVTKYVWPEPAFWVTRLCARAGITPNMVTALGAGLTLLAFLAFWQGAFGWGLLAGWTMCFLDTVDGKLARCTLTSSPFGNLFDHGIDLVHPPFWYLAWYAGLPAGLPAGLGGPVLAVILGGYVLGRLMEGWFLKRFGFHLHVWRRFDSAFRLVLARRNPNMILLTLGWALLWPGLGLMAVAVWTLATLAVHAIQLTQAEAAARRRGRPPVSWLEAQA